MKDGNSISTMIMAAIITAKTARPHNSRERGISPSRRRTLSERISGSASKFKLIFNKVIIYSMALYQRAVVSRLHHTTTIEHHDIVSITYRRKPMGHHHHCTPFVKSGKILHDCSLILRIKRICSLIKKNIRRIAIDGSCYEHPLLLPLTESDSVRTYLRVIFQRQ